MAALLLYVCSRPPARSEDVEHRILVTVYGVLIHNFIDEHPTDAELEFNRLSLIPHDRATLGEFRTLPQELQKFSVPK